MSNKIVAWLYFVVYLCLWPLAKFYALFDRKFRAQLEGRNVSNATLETLATASKRADKRAVFFCSSAGEFEQAIPLIHRLEAVQVFTHTFFFSRSGFDYAKARQFGHSYSMAPYDLPFQWHRLFSTIMPDLAVVVRYELWPGFLYTADKYCSLYLINASQSHRRIDPFKHLLLRYFTGIFFVSDDGLSSLPWLQQSAQTAVVGDTKYDRVLERAASNGAQIDGLRTRIAKTFADRLVVVLGSCWSADTEVFAEAWRDLPEASRNKLAVIFAPHDISEKNLLQTEAVLKATQNDCIRFSRWMNDPKLAHGGTFIIVDTMGRLAEIYGAANCAMVGGAMHYKVHNVLEPASHGLAVSFGPRFHSQKEAALLVERGVATVIQDANDLKAWLLQQVSGSDETGARALELVKELSGATEKILNQISELNWPTN